MPTEPPVDGRFGQARAAFTDTSGWVRVEQDRYEDMLVLDGSEHTGGTVEATLSVMDLGRWSTRRGEPELGTMVAREAWTHGDGDGRVHHGVLTTRSMAGDFGDLVLRTWSFQSGDVVASIDCTCPVDWFPALTPIMDSLVAGLRWDDGSHDVTAPDEAPLAARVPAFTVPNSSDLPFAAADALFELGVQGGSRRYLGSSTAAEFIRAGMFRADGQPTAATEMFIDAAGEPEYGMELEALSGGIVRTLRLRFRGPWVAAIHHEHGSPDSSVALLRRTQAPDVMARWSGLHPVHAQLASPVDVSADAFQRRVADANEPVPAGPDDHLMAALWNTPWRVLRTRWTHGHPERPSPSGESRLPYSAILMAGEVGYYRFGTVDRLASSVRLGPVPASELFRQWVLDASGIRIPEKVFSGG